MHGKSICFCKKKSYNTNTQIYLKIISNLLIIPGQHCTLISDNLTDISHDSCKLSDVRLSWCWEEYLIYIYTRFVVNVEVLDKLVWWTDYSIENSEISSSWTTYERIMLGIKIFNLSCTIWGIFYSKTYLFALPNLYRSKQFNFLLHLYSNTFTIAFWLCIIWLLKQNTSQIYMKGPAYQ